MKVFDYLLVYSTIKSEKSHPASIVGAGHPGVRNYLVRHQHLHVHVVVDQVRQSDVPEH